MNLFIKLQKTLINFSLRINMKFIILGCGSSMGVPRADGDFGKCNPREKKILEQDALLY